MVIGYPWSQRFEGLRVAARTSSFQFNGRTADVRKVAQELGVNSVLEGGVRKAGSRWHVACVFAVAGDTDRAIDLLERAVLPEMANRVWLEHDSDLDSVRELPRFKEFVATLN